MINMKLLQSVLLTNRTLTLDPHHLKTGPDLVNLRILDSLFQDSVFYKVH